MNAADPEAIREAAGTLGFEFVGVTGADPAAADGEFLTRWLSEGKAAGMAWLGRDPARRSTPKAFLPEALSLISLGVRYYQGPLPPPPDVPAGRVARYAWGGDYHAVIEERLEKFRGELARIFGPGVISRPAVDAQPLLERAFARRGGLGFVGKNTNLIRPGVGSYLFLADVLVNLEWPADPSLPQGCGACVKCSAACPTGALDEAYVLDSGLCIAYHTIENRGDIPRHLRPKMGNWLFGCDDCQDICPFNTRVGETRWREFRAERGPGAWLALGDVLRLRTAEAWKKRFQGTSILRAKRAGLVRNACVSAANLGFVEELAPELEDCLRRDSEPVVRSHAAWALGRAGNARSRGILDRAHGGEPDPGVREEMEAALDFRP